MKSSKELPINTTGTSRQTPAFENEVDDTVTLQRLSGLSRKLSRCHEPPTRRNHDAYELRHARWIVGRLVGCSDDMDTRYSAHHPSSWLIRMRSSAPPSDLTQ